MIVNKSTYWNESIFSEGADAWEYVYMFAYLPGESSCFEVVGKTG